MVIQISTFGQLFVKMSGFMLSQSYFHTCSHLYYSISDWNYRFCPLNTAFVIKFSNQHIFWHLWSIWYAMVEHAV